MKYVVIFTTETECSVLVEAPSVAEAIKKVQGKTWEQLKDSGFNPEVDYCNEKAKVHTILEE